MPFAVNLFQENLASNQIKFIRRQYTPICKELGRVSHCDDAGNDGWFGLEMYMYKGLCVVFNPRTEETELAFWIHSEQEKIDTCIDTYNKLCLKRAMRAMYEEEMEGR